MAMPHRSLSFAQGQGDLCCQWFVTRCSVQSIRRICGGGRARKRKQRAAVNSLCGHCALAHTWQGAAALERKHRELPGNRDRAGLKAMVTTSSQIESNPALPGVEASLGLRALSTETRMAALMAGARARGVADTLDLLGIAAILVDSDGAALHVNTQAAAFMGPNLGICARQLVAGTFAANASLQRALDLVLSRGGAESVDLAAESGGADIVLHVLGLPVALDETAQLLKAIIVLESCTAPCGELALAARILRHSARLN